jgi:hypothetical protein
LALSGPFYEGLLYAAHNNRFERFTVFRPPALPEVSDSPVMIDLQIVIVLSILVAAVILFIWDKFSPDIVALLVVPAIEARCKLLMTQGIPNKMLDRNWIQSHKQEILNRVQLRGEEYNYFAGNCARSAALAVMEEFGLGNIRRASDG